MLHWPYLTDIWKFERGITDVFSCTADSNRLQTPDQASNLSAFQDRLTAGSFPPLHFRIQPNNERNNKMKYITFLGLGGEKGYRELVTYFEGQEEDFSVTCLVQSHIYSCFKDKIDEVHVFLTEESKERYFDELCECIPPDLIHEIKISQNISSEEFVNHLIQILKDDDEVILDVTHSFRKIPIRLLFALRYVEAMKNVNIQHIFYGEVEKQNTDDSYSIIHDLARDYQIQKITEYLSQFDRTLTIQEEDWKSLVLVDEPVRALLQSLTRFNEMTEFCDLSAAVNAVNEITDRASAIENQARKITGVNPYALLLPLTKNIKDKFLKARNKQKEKDVLIEIIRIMLEHQRYQLAITFTDELFTRELIHSVIEPQSKKFDEVALKKKLKNFSRMNQFTYQCGQYLKYVLGLRSNYTGKNERVMETAFDDFNENIDRLLPVCQKYNEDYQHFSNKIRNSMNHGSGMKHSSADLQKDIQESVTNMLNFIQEL